MTRDGACLFFALTALLLIAGCTVPGTDTTDQPDEVTPAMNDTNTDDSPVPEMHLTSPAFDHGEQIPTKYGYTQENVNPPLALDGVPEKAETLVLIMDDPDAMQPAGKVWDHWIVFDIDPLVTEIPEDAVPSGGVEGTNDFGEIGYGGPNPPDTEHTYRFKLYALDTALNLSSSAKSADVEKAMDGHVLLEAQLNGTFSPEQTG